MSDYTVLADVSETLLQLLREQMTGLVASDHITLASPADVELDNVDLGTYLATRGEGLPLIRSVLEQAYVAEYGLDADRVRARFADYTARFGL